VKGQEDRHEQESSVSLKVKMVLAVCVVGASFLAGFVPKFLEVRQLRAQLADTRTSLSDADLQRNINEIRILAGRILLEASRQNYGTAAGYSTDYFDRVRELRERTENPQTQTALAELVSQRDSITSGLAQADAAVISALQMLVEKTYNLPDKI
jgi:hypothetical protein